MGKVETFERVEKAISTGQLWRAKEFLQGNICNCGYDAEVYARYGQVLLQMGDLMEAGKFLFLSGSRTPEYENSINLYLDRYTRKDFKQIYHTFPYAAKLATLDDYPETVKNDLCKIGFNSEIIKKIHKPFEKKEHKPRTRIDKIKGWCLGIIGLFLVAACMIGIAEAIIFGIKTILKWLFK